MELLRAYSSLRPPPPPPPPRLPPEVKRRKTVECHEHVAGANPTAFNVFGRRGEEWLESAERQGREMFRHAADYELWASALCGVPAEVVTGRLACIQASENCFRLVTDSDFRRRKSLPPTSMASWGLREYVMLQRVVKPHLDAKLTEVVKAIDVWEEEQAALLDMTAGSVSEPFADVTLDELMSGKIHSQSLAKPEESPQSLWRAALGAVDQDAFQEVLRGQVVRNWPLWASAVDVEINTIRLCKTWPLRMYLRMQQQRSWSESAEEKLKLLLEAERSQVLHWQDYMRKAEPEWMDVVLSLR